MLARQAVIYFAANIFSAAFGFFNVVVFTRVFSVDAFGDYLLGLSFSTLFATVLSSAVKLAILREQSKGDGTDIRPTALAAMLLGMLMAPAGYGAARLMGLDASVAATSVLLCYAVVAFDVSQEVLRAEQKAMDYLRGVVARAILVTAIGVSCTLLGKSGALLTGAAALAYALATLTFWRKAWGRAHPHFALNPLRALIVNGLPLTLSLTLLALAGATDRFLLANLMGSGAAGQFGASFDLVRQSLIIPAVSVASAFVPMAVKLHAGEGDAAARGHLGKCLELLMAIVLPACIGFAMVSPQMAALVLGPDFREMARAAMPVLSLAVVFQIATQQYLHTSFLLSNRNVFYLINTGSIVVFNVIASYLLIGSFGVMGAVWGRFATDVFGFANALVLSRYAFALPLAPARLLRVAAATTAMAAAVRLLASYTGDSVATLLLLIPAGVFVYALAALVLDIAEARDLLRKAAARVEAWRRSSRLSPAEPLG